VCVRTRVCACVRVHEAHGRGGGFVSALSTFTPSRASHTRAHLGSRGTGVCFHVDCVFVMWNVRVCTWLLAPLAFVHSSKLLVLSFAGKVHGSLSRAGKVKNQTPKVPKQEKKNKNVLGRAKKRIQFNRRFVNVVVAVGGRRPGPNKQEVGMVPGVPFLFGCSMPWRSRSRVVGPIR
jgi:small subunit ribosomal protein S30e